MVVTMNEFKSDYSQFIKYALTDVKQMQRMKGRNRVLKLPVMKSA